GIANLHTILFCLERGQKLVFEADSKIQGDVRMNLPGVLNEEALVAAGDVTCVCDAIFPVVISVVAFHVLNASTGKRLTPVENEVAIGEVIQHIIVQARELIATLERVLAGDV